MSERQASNFRRGQFTKAHITALNILSQYGIWYEAEKVVNCFGKFDSLGRPVSYKCDIVINDPRYGSGVIEIEGKGTNSNDPKRDHDLLETGFQWIEHIPNEAVKQIMVYLQKHQNPDIVEGTWP